MAHALSQSSEVSLLKNGPFPPSQKLNKSQENASLHRGSAHEGPITLCLESLAWSIATKGKAEKHQRKGGPDFFTI